MATFVYILCALTSGLCAGLLFRSAARNGGRLLRWSAWAFVCFAAANILLVLDKAVVPDVDLYYWRNLITFAGIALMLYAIIWETD